MNFVFVALLNETD